MCDYDKRMWISWTHDDKTWNNTIPGSCICNIYISLTKRFNRFSLISRSLPIFCKFPAHQRWCNNGTFVTTDNKDQVGMGWTVWDKFSEAQTLPFKQPIAHICGSSKGVLCFFTQFRFGNWRLCVTNRWSHKKMPPSWLLWKNCEGKWTPLSYIKKECLAVVFTVLTFHLYLTGRPFSLFVDNNNQDIYWIVRRRCSQSWKDGHYSWVNIVPDSLYSGKAKCDCWCFE